MRKIYFTLTAIALGLYFSGIYAAPVDCNRPTDSPIPACNSLSYVLNVGKTGSGAGKVRDSSNNISCGSLCSARFIPNQSVTLTATPGTNSIFTGWSGACVGSGGCTVRMNSTK